MLGALVLAQVLAFQSWQGACDGAALTIPVVGGDLVTPEGLHRALYPAWDSLVEHRNNAGLVGPKEEGKPQPPLSQDETLFQYERVQRGEVDSARLLLVFGMVPSTGYMDNSTAQMFADEHRKNSEQLSADGEDVLPDASNLPVALDPKLRYPDGSTPLHMAASFGLVGSIESLLKARADIAAVARSGQQPIHNAAIMGHHRAVELLVELRADTNTGHSFVGSTSLHFAAEMGHPHVVKRLCELRADVEAEKRQGGTALHISADTNNSAVAKVLLEEPCGAEPDAVLLGDTVPLYLAAGRGFQEVIDVLLDGGANPDRTLWPERPWQKRKKKRRRKHKQNLEDQALQTRVDLTQALPGSHPSAPGWEAGNGATALHNACENGHLKAAVALLDGGARQLATMEGVTPLIIALQYRHPLIAARLLDHKTPANVAVVSPKDGQTALHIAAAYDYPEVVARILRQGGSADVRDGRGNVPANYARGRLTQMLLGRFQGREPKLDSIVRANHGRDVEPLLQEAIGVEDEVKGLYLKYARLHSEGDIAAELGRLTEALRSAETTQETRAALMQQFAIARFLLAGSDAPLAVEAMLQKTEPGMHAGLALLGIRVKSIEYQPKKHLQVNGKDVHRAVNRLISAAMKSAQKGDAEDFENALQDLHLIFDTGQRQKAEHKEACDATSNASEEGMLDSVIEDIAEL